MLVVPPALDGFFSKMLISINLCFFSNFKASETLLRMNTGSRDYLYTKDRQCNSDLAFLAALVSKCLVLFSVI